MPVCLWSIHAIHQGLFLAWALTLPLTVPADREALSRELQERCCSQSAAALTWGEPGHVRVWELCILEEEWWLYNCVTLGEVFQDLHFPEQLQALRVVTLGVGQKGKTLPCLSAGLCKCHKTCSLPTSRVGRLPLITAFFDPHTWTLVQLGFFLIVEVESCVSKKSLSTFFVLSTIVFEGSAIFSSRTPANIFQAANWGPDKPITCSRSQRRMWKFP